MIEGILTLGGGGRELLGRMVELYIQDVPERIATIRDGMARGDGRTAARAAHALKSACANVGAAALVELCKRLESQCRDGATAGAGPLAEAIEDEFARVAAELAGRVRETAA